MARVACQKQAAGAEVAEVVAVRVSWNAAILSSASCIAAGKELLTPKVFCGI